METRQKRLVRIILGIVLVTSPIYLTTIASIASRSYLPILVNNFALPSPTPGPPYDTGDILITDIFYDGLKEDEPDEFVEIYNVELFSIQLANWTLRDKSGHIFTFPDYIIQPGQLCRIHTNEVHPDWCGFSYGRSSSVWNNSGDCAYLRDATGKEIDRYSYPSDGCD